MDRKTGFDYRVPILFAFCLLTITISLALYTENPELGTPNEDSYVEECKPYFLNGVQCPLDKNQSGSNHSNSNTSFVNESVNRGR